MSTQLDLFTHTTTGRIIPGGWGRCITSPNDVWRAKWTGPRWGWVFYRFNTEGEWESWEPELPYGTSFVIDRVAAENLLADLVHRFGDRPLSLP